MSPRVARAERESPAPGAAVRLQLRHRESAPEWFPGTAPTPGVNSRHGPAWGVPRWSERRPDAPDLSEGLDRAEAALPPRGRRTSSSPGSASAAECAGQHGRPVHVQHIGLLQSDWSPALDRVRSLDPTAVMRPPPCARVHGSFATCCCAVAVRRFVSAHTTLVDATVGKSPLYERHDSSGTTPSASSRRAGRFVFGCRVAAGAERSAGVCGG